MNRRSALALFGLLGAFALSPQSVSALTVTVTSHGSDQIWIGMVGNTAMAVQVWGSSCSFYTLGNGGLTEDTTVVGTSSRNEIEVVDPGSSHTLCNGGTTLSALVTNGRKLTIRGGSGNDAIWGSTIAYTIRGEGGNDWLVTSLAAQIYGGDGADFIRGGWASQFRGEAGDDRMCALSGTAATLMDGGLGIDTYCGISIQAPVSAIPATSCNGFGSCQQ